MNTRSITVLTVLCIAAPAVAGVPVAGVGGAFIYQGQLKQAGAPYEGSARFEFTLWDADILGREVAPSQDLELVVTNGLFSAPLDFGTVPFAGEARWLQVSVDTGRGSVVLSPRQEVTPTPYAFTALNTVGVDGHSLDGVDAGPTDAVFVDTRGNVGVGTTTPGARLDVNGAVQASGLKLTDAPVAGYVLTSDASGNGTWQTPPAGSDSPWTENRDEIYYTGGNVGIGTATPAAPLDVAGGVSMDGFQMGERTTAGHVLTTDANGVGTWQAPPAGGDSLWLSNRNDIYFSSGLVGIGTSTPAVPLDVAGTIAVDGFQMGSRVPAGHVLTADANGVGTWRAPTGGGGGLTLPFDSTVHSAAPAFSITQEGIGSAGMFGSSNTETTQAALTAITTGSGDAFIAAAMGGTARAGYFYSQLLDNEALGVKHQGIGTALKVTSGAVNTENTLYVSTLGTGSTAEFKISNTASTADAVTAETNGSGSAGYFKTTDSDNTAAALVAESNGDNNAFHANAKGTGSAVHAYNAFDGNGITSVVEGAGGTAGSFTITDSNNTRAAIEATTQSVGAAAWFTNTNPNGWASYHSGRVHFEGRVGIGTQQPDSLLEVVNTGDTTWSLDVDNTLKVRPDNVVVDGALEVEEYLFRGGPRIGYYVVGPADFMPRKDSGSDRYYILYDLPEGESGAKLGPDTAGYMMAPVHLPHGAEVIGLTVYGYDGSANYNLSMGFSRMNMTNGAQAVVAQVESGGSGGYQTIVGDIQTYNPTIDNTIYCYFVWGRGYGTDGKWSSSIKIMGARITYEMAGPD